jgi:MYXO-CTERM domain-containing protein
MKLSTLTAAALLSLGVVSTQASAKTEDLGTVTSAGTTFGNTFYVNNSFTDYYTFNINGSSDVSGQITDSDATGFNAGLFSVWFTQDVVLQSVSLTQTLAGVTTTLYTDLTPNSFTFTGLAGGSYSLAVSGYVQGSPSFLGGSYSGRVSAVASPAPEPADMALTLMGLAGVAFWVRRRKAA